ncbi:MAG TPA: EAL domain-containing protein [Pyrinomonadaceae bacterium]|nr:EAL domain-containing protein [Pyrinomonadaceae bacterium]
MQLTDGPHESLGAAIAAATTATHADAPARARVGNSVFRWTVVALGLAVIVVSLDALPTERLDVRFLLLALMTLVISPRAGVSIPLTTGRITVADTFILLSMLLFGGEAATLLAVAEGLCSSLRFSRKPLTVLFNGAVMGCATYLTSWALHLFFGRPEELPAARPAIFITALCVMALSQYVTNAGLVALDKALKLGQPFRHVWCRYYLWTSITYFAGAAAAGLIGKLTQSVGFYPVVAATPVAAIVYLTYQTYLKSVETAATQAQMAESHVAELNHYLVEQERISRELQESREHFRNAALHDALTGLPNRTLLMNHLKLAVEHAKRRPEYLFAALFLDLDRFKVINDSLGHLAGDQLLVELARRLEDCVRTTDIVARLGGDEFAILLSDLEDSADAVRVSERIQEELRRPFRLGGQEVYTSASIGITLSATGYRDPEAILRDADTVMYRAKANGKARHELFDAQMHARAVALLQMETDLRRAVERREFQVHYQPIVSLRSGRVAGLEALVRWQHPERGCVPPADFIPVAEETGLILEIGRQVLRDACAQMRRWQLEGVVAPSLTLSVNLGGKQFNRPDLAERIDQALYETGLDPRCLKLEITESVIMGNAEAACVTLAGLRGLGMGISIDDFGTGYSSLSYLHRFPVNTLKVDRSFIGRMGSPDENSEIVRTIITLGSNLGMEVVAEGVETELQDAQLKSLGCHYAQGFLYSAPLDAQAASAWLRRQATPHASSPNDELALFGIIE